MELFWHQSRGKLLGAARHVIGAAGEGEQPVPRKECVHRQRGETLDRLRVGKYADVMKRLQQDLAAREDGVPRKETAFAVDSAMEYKIAQAVARHEMCGERNVSMLDGCTLSKANHPRAGRVNEICGVAFSASRGKACGNVVPIGDGGSLGLRDAEKATPQISFTRPARG